MASWKLQVEHALGESIESAVSISGNSAFQVKTRRGFYFAKVTPTAREEAEGLQALLLRTPKVLHLNSDLLLLEWIESEPPTVAFWQRLGSQLAKMHEEKGEQFGFFSDNHIGPTKQLNPQRSIREVSWAEYFIEYRLKPMLHHSELAPDALLQASFAKAEPSIRKVLEQVKEKPCLLHGDLWNGNFLCAPDQTPVLIDPAVYYGHREVDLAMSELFGGFDPAFYTAYGKMPAGYEVRKMIYNLYHLLNHWILFGESYRDRVLQSLKSL